MSFIIVNIIWFFICVGVNNHWYKVCEEMNRDWYERCLQVLRKSSAEEIKGGPDGSD